MKRQVTKGKSDNQYLRKKPLTIVREGLEISGPFFTESQIGGDEENRTPVRNRLGRDNLRVQSAFKKFPLRMSPLTG